jgi:ADP-heptose:LPS heptosyltransferase
MKRASKNKPRHMTTVLDRLPSGSRVSVIRLRSLGDCVLTTPALALLKSHRPDLRISVIVEPRFAPVFAGNPDVDETRESIGARPDLVLNLHGGTRSMLMTAASLAKIRAGFAHHRHSFLYTDRIPTAQQILSVDRKVHTAEHLGSAMFWLGVPRTEIPRAKLSATNPPDLPSYAVIHPFAATPEKTWPAEKFVAIARHLRSSAALEPVFIAGPGDDAAPFRDSRIFSNEPLDRVKSLLAGAQLFIGNDSGPAHIAAAFGVPVVVLFGPSDSVVWAPWRTESRVLASPQGIAAITVDQVTEALTSLKVHA